MKKLVFVCAGLLLLSTYVSAEEHAETTLEHTHQAVVHGMAGHTPVLISHVKAALEHVLAASIAAKGVSKTHLDAAATELQESLDQANLGHIGMATTHAKAALDHITASSSK